MKRTMNSFLFCVITGCSFVKAGQVTAMDNVLKERKTFYSFNGSVEIETSKHEVDLVKESGIILSKEREDNIKNKRTPEEIKESMAVYKYGEKVKSTDAYVKKKLKSPKRSHVFKTIKTHRKKTQKKHKKNTMLHQLYYSRGNKQ